MLKTVDGHFIFQRRDKAAKRYPGMIAPFGGSIEGGETALEALVRELKEETELDVDSGQLERVGRFGSYIKPDFSMEIFCLKNVDPEKIVLHEGEGVVVLTAKEALENDQVTAFTKEIILSLQNKDPLYLKVPGEHNIWNATAVLTLIDELGLDVGKAKKVLAEFTGAKRRFELMGETNGILVYDDYAHHPVEIAKLLKAAREKFGSRKIWAVFQAHTYTRTKALLAEFGQAFKDADAVIVLPIFGSAREQQETVSPEDLAAEIDKNSHNVLYHGTIEQVTEYLAKEAKSGDVVITIGAGENWKVGAKLLEKL